MDILGKLVMVTIFILPTISLLPIYGQNIVNNTANTIENAAEENRKIDLNNIYKETNKLEANRFYRTSKPSGRGC